MLRNRLRAAREWFSRAWGSNGYERRTLLLIAKSTLAASISWFAANSLIGAQSAAFAPFTAILIMQVTVYSSVVQSLRYVGAVVLGIGVQAFLSFTIGPTVLTFAVVALIALSLGRLRFLGAQANQVATAAIFAFSSFLTAGGFSGRLEALGEILLLVLMGCAVGIAVNVVVFPPLRYRSAEKGVNELAHSVCDLLGDIGRSLGEGTVEEDTAQRWWNRCEQIESTVAQARSSVETARESGLYNPARLWTRHRMQASFDGYEQLIDGLGRAVRQLGSLARALYLWSDGEGASTHAGFLRSYGDFLEALGGVADTFSRIDEDRLEEQATELGERCEQAQQRCSELTDYRGRQGAPDFEDLTLPYGVLLIESQRLMGEFQYSCDIFRYYASDRRD